MKYEAGGDSKTNLNISQLEMQEEIQTTTDKIQADLAVFSIESVEIESELVSQASVISEDYSCCDSDCKQKDMLDT